MSNSNTAHSRQLRQATAAQWSKENARMLTISASKTNTDAMDAMDAMDKQVKDTGTSRQQVLVSWYKAYQSIK